VPYDAGQNGQVIHTPKGKLIPQALTLPARYYTSPEVFQHDMESFFRGSWIGAGRAEAIANPGDYFVREVAGESLIVTRGADGQIRVFYNVCRHRGTRLCTEAEGKFAGRIQCPYHGWTYGLDGRLAGAPNMGEGFAREDYPLREGRADVWDGHIFLHLGDSPAPLGEQLGALPDKFAAWGMADLRPGRRIVYDVRANWKLIVANYNECLHCPLVHPALNRLTDYLGADNEAPSPHYIGGTMGFRDGIETMNFDGRRPRAYLPELDETQRGHVYYYAVFPNFLLSLHPDYMLVHTLWPRAVDRTEIVCEWFFHPTEQQFADAVEFWDLTNRQDWRICELSQAGIGSSAYTPGPYSPREELLAAFDKIVLERERRSGLP
jgi:Rieske 2Fe-2S family protein